MTTLTRKKTSVEKRRDAAFVQLEAWRKRNAKFLKNFDPVAAVCKIRESR